MSDPTQDRAGRRKLLATAANPAARLDYVVTVTCPAAINGQSGIEIKFRYVPDRLILEREAVSAYLLAVEAAPWDGLEELALTLLDDISNEAVPRWTEVSVAQSAPAPGAADYLVVMEDRQPNWSNAALLARLTPWSRP